MNKGRNRAISLLMVFLLVTTTILGNQTLQVSANSSIKVTITHPEMNTIKLSWGKVSGATGYNIYYSTSQNGTYQLVSSIKDTSIIFNELKTDTYYYFKVNAYTLQDGAKVEGATSGVQKIRSNRIGIDVSHHQGKIDWNKVKADGIEFAFVRISYGTKTKDDYYEANLKGAAAAGIPVGAYIYSRAMTTAEVKAEAEYALKLLEGKKLSYPLVYDIEADDFHKNLSAATNTGLVKTFMEIVKKAGYDVVLYTGCNFSSNKLNMSQLTMYDWWIPHYATSAYYYAYTSNYHFKSPTESGACYYAKNGVKTRFWQYTERGKVNGVSGYVDMDYELDLNEPKTSCTYVSIKTEGEKYVAGSNETIRSIAQKLGIEASILLNKNSGYTLDSVVKAGKSIVFDSAALATPEVTTKVASKSAILISYNNVKNAAGYEIYASTSKTGAYEKLADTTELNYIHEGLSTANTYYYKVVAYATVDGKRVTESSQVVSRRLVVDKVTNLKAVSTEYNSIKLTWNKAEEATGYRVYSSTSKSGTYKLIKTTTGTSFTNSGLTPKQTVYYKVKAYIKGTTSSEIESGYSSVVSAKPMQAAITNLKATSITNNKVTLSFTKSNNASYYKVFRATSKNGTYKGIGTIKTTTYVDSNLKANTNYYYKVCAYRTVNGVTHKSTDSSILTAKTLQLAPSITLIKGGSKSVNIEWSKVSGAAGYELYRSTSKNGTYKLVTSKTSRVVKNTGLAANTTYYYKVRSYTVVNKKKVYSNYSTIKSVKTSK